VRCGIRVRARVKLSTVAGLEESCDGTTMTFINFGAMVAYMRA
jgi:hypothetical protein